MIFEIPVPVIYIALAILSVSFLLCLYRVVVGPTVFDRALALDVMSFVAMAVIAVFSIYERSLNYFPAILVFALLGFFGLVAVAKFLLRGDIIDRNS
jgi:multisubunit Na+/H+ antiporter MnhF subunit